MRSTVLLYFSLCFFFLLYISQKTIKFNKRNTHLQVGAVASQTENKHK